MKELLQGVSVFLIGMMGTGKTTVGEVLARRLEYYFFDTDELIVKLTRKSINEVFATEGEATFREMETQILAELSAYKNTVVATGGGIVLKPENWSYLHHGLVIWLDAPVSLLCQRLAGDETRPLLQETDLDSRLEHLLGKRRSLYAEADLHINIQPDDTPTAIVDTIFEQIPTVLKSSISLPDAENN